MGETTHGHPPTLDEAKAKFRAAWEKAKAGDTEWSRHRGASVWLIKRVGFQHTVLSRLRPQGRRPPEAFRITLRGFESLLSDGTAASIAGFNCQSAFVERLDTRHATSIGMTASFHGRTKLMFSNYRSGLKNWSCKLRKIWMDSEFAGIEKWARRSLYFLRILSVSEHIAFFIIGPKYRREDYRRDLWITDSYVVGKTIAVALLTCLPERYLGYGAWIASYLLAEMYVALFNIIFVGTLPEERPISIPRSLLLLVLNALQITLTFALYYRIALPSLDADVAIARSFQVFGTVGHPVPDGSTQGLYLVAFQIFLDFVFVAILLARFLGQAANSKERDQPIEVNGSQQPGEGPNSK